MSTTRSTKTARPQVDPETLALARAAHRILRQRGDIPRRLSLADWVCDAIYERAYSVLRPALGDAPSERSFSTVPDNLLTTGRVRSLHFT